MSHADNTISQTQRPSHSHNQSRHSTATNVFIINDLKWKRIENRALVKRDLDTFAHRVFNNLFNAIYNHNKDAVQMQQQQTIELNESYERSIR